MSDTFQRGGDRIRELERVEYRLQAKLAFCRERIVAVCENPEDSTRAWDDPDAAVDADWAREVRLVRVLTRVRAALPAEPMVEIAA